MKKILFTVIAIAMGLFANAEETVTNSTLSFDRIETEEGVQTAYFKLDNQESFTGFQFKVTAEGITLPEEAGYASGEANKNVGTTKKPVYKHTYTWDNNTLVVCSMSETVLESGEVAAIDFEGQNGSLKLYSVVGAGADAVSHPMPDVLVEIVNGQATGINTVINADQKSGTAKYVQNGQVVIEKAGKKFNAAGAQLK